MSTTALTYAETVAFIVVVGVAVHYLAGVDWLPGRGDRRGGIDRPALADPRRSGEAHLRKAHRGRQINGEVPVATTIKNVSSRVPDSQARRRDRRLEKPERTRSNVVYKRLRERGYEVFAINPNAQEVEGDPSYSNLRSVPGGVEAVVIATRPPEIADETMRECAELGGSSM